MNTQPDRHCQPTWKDCVSSSRRMPFERSGILVQSGQVSLLLLLGITAGTPAIAYQPAAIAPSGSAPATVNASSEEDGYLLGAGDRIRIDVFNVPEFTGEFLVLPNGTVNLPQVGAVSVQGRTLRQASQAISTRYSSMLTRPIITLSLLAARPITIVLAGEVNRPGAYAIPPNDGGVPSLTRTLQLAEGVTQSADLQRVQIRRPRPASLGGDQVVTVDLWQLVNAGDSRQDLRLQDGDSIFIPSSAEIGLREARQLASTNLAARSNRPMKIAVVGEVSRPGPYTIFESAGGNSGAATNSTPVGQASATPSQTPSVTQAIQAAGGITQLADIRNIQVRRLTRNGSEQIVKVDFWRLVKTGDVLQDLPLQDGDTISIPTVTSINDQEITEVAGASISPSRIVINVVGEVTRPGQVEVAPNAPLNQALLAAGGFNTRARKRAVTLVRLNPNGTVLKRDIEIDFGEGISGDRNPSLRNNDIIIVRRNAIAGIADTLGAVTTPLSNFVGIFRLFGIPFP